MTVYAALDSRVDNAPAWLADYTQTEMTATNSKDVVFKLYAKEVKAGETVILGENGQVSGCVNYTVFAAEAKTEPVTGDVNGDGTTSVLDVVMLQKWLLNKGDLTNWEAADLCQDGRIDVFDLCLLKKALLKQ